MVNIIRQNALRGGIRMKSALGRRQLLAAALMTAVGFTSAFAVIIDIPPLRWEIEYKSRLRVMLLASQASGLQVMNTGIQWQSARSFVAASKSDARRRVREIIALLRNVYASVMALPANLLHLGVPGHRWQLAVALEVTNVPTHGYTMSHGLQLFKFLGCMDVAQHPYATLPGETICVRGGLSR